MFKGIANRKGFTDGQLIFREGQKGTSAFLINSGKVELRKVVDGKEQVLATIGKRELFGEMALIDDAPRMASAIAVGLLDCTVIEKHLLLEKLEQLDEDARFVITYLMNYIRVTVPFELRTDFDENAPALEKDMTAGDIISSKYFSSIMKDQIPFMRALYEVLITYTIRRLPLNLRSSAIRAPQVWRSDRAHHQGSIFQPIGRGQNLTVSTAFLTLDVSTIK